jgi:hypothetical protein
LKLWIEVLGDLGDPAVLPALNRALAQDVEDMSAVVDAARAKIEKRSGVPPPVSYQGDGQNGVIEVGKQKDRIVEGSVRNSE